MTQRTELFRYDTKDWTYLLNATQIIQPFFNMIQRVFEKMTLSILPFLKYDSRIGKTMTHRIEPFLLIWLTEWNPSFQFDSKNWILFKILLKELNPFQHMTRRIEHFLSIELFQYDWKGLKFSICFEELNPFLGMTSRMDFFGKVSQIFEPFLNMTQRSDFFQMIPQ